MRYSIDGSVYRLTRITGPTHNLLGLGFGHESGGRIIIERLAGPSGPAIDEGLLEQAVLSGVEAANDALGTDYRPTRIQYVPSDTPDPGIYQNLARVIVERLASGVDYASD